MKRISIIFLQLVIVLCGIGMAIFLLWEPHLEGRNVGSTLFEIYFKDPFLAYVYVGSIPFFVGLYMAFKALGHVRQDGASLREIIKALRIIKYCAFATAGFILGADLYLFIFNRDNDDPAGAIALGLVAIFISLVIANLAAVLEGVLQKAVENRTS